MVKFNLKKKIAKALVFAMVMGTVGVRGLVSAPVAAVKAENEVLTITANVVDGADVERNDVITCGATLLNAEGQSIIADYELEWTFSGDVTQDNENKSKFTVNADAIANSQITITVTAKSKTDAPELTKSIVFTVKVTEVTPPSTTKPFEATINYKDFTAVITPGENKYVFIEVLKGEEANAKISATYCYTVGSATEIVIDLSFLNPKKAQYIRIYGDSDMDTKDEKDPKTIYAQPAKEAFKYVPGQDSVAASFKIKDTAMTDASLYQYKTLYGSNWKELNNDWSLETSAIAGTTILIRRKAVEESTDPDATVTPAPAGPEAKVKIAASPKAPKVTVDYVKDAVTLPKGGQFRVITRNADGSILLDGGETSFIDVPSTNKMSVEKLLEAWYNVTETTTTITNDIDHGFTIVARTKATEKKAASVPTFVAILPQPKIVADNDAKTVEGLVKDSDGKPVVSGSVTWTVTTDNKGKSTATFTAKDASFEFKLKDETKWKTVKAGGAYVVKDVTTDGKDVEIRRTGIKPNKEGKGACPASNVETVKVQVSATEEKPSGGDEEGEGGEATDKVTVIELTETSGSVDLKEVTNSEEITIKVTAKAGETVVTTAELDYQITSQPNNADGVVVTDGKITVTKNATLGEYKITVSVKGDSSVKSVDYTLTVRDTSSEPDPNPDPDPNPEV